MRFLILFLPLFLSACSTQIVEMAPEPTPQEFDLIDNEGDGIISARDKCPNSIPGSNVNNNGCATHSVDTVRRRLEVNFETNSAVVKDSYLPEIEKLADFLTEYPKTKVTIEGHTSIRGSAELNKNLSQRRAQAIKDILIDKFAIDSERITAIGYGFERLLLEGDDEYIHARNRRIVAEISSDISLTDMKWNIYSVDGQVE